MFLPQWTLLLIPVMDAYVKTIPAATLSASTNPEGQTLFLDFVLR
jgi:hypothetical protein